jgi:hypothetical protein
MPNGMMKERVFVKMARFEKDHPIVVKAITVLAILSAALGWSGRVEFLNNVFASILAAVGIIGLVGSSVIWLAVCLTAPIGFLLPITYLPRSPSGTRYRYVRPTTKSGSHLHATSATVDLSSFVQFSISDLAIAGAYPELNLEGRTALYERWYHTCPKSFLTVERRSFFGRWYPIGVSIILPLNHLGREKFCIGDLNVLGIDERHIAPAPGEAIAFIIDTLIVLPRFRTRNEGYAFPGLFIRHLAELWDGRDAWLLVEPDSKKLERNLLTSLRFRRIERATLKAPLYEFHYPYDIVGEKLKGAYTNIVNNVLATRSWPIG